MKKSIISLLILSIICYAFAGCGNKTVKDYSKYPFVNVSWARACEGDTEFIYFSDDGEFSYYCACGNPVDDSDMCEGYTYNPETKKITLIYEQGSNKTITLKECNGEILVLDFDGDERSFEKENQPEQVDSFTYNGEVYCILEYNNEFFYYDLAGDIAYEEDDILPVSHDKWKVLYYNGDLFIAQEQLEEAKSYYADDNNYSWSFWIDDDSESPPTNPISLTENDLSDIYAMKNSPKTDTLKYEDIQKFGTLNKTSLDGLVTASLQLAFYDGCWYYRTEIIDESQKGWPEYVIRLPEKINDTMNNLK